MDRIVIDEITKKMWELLRYPSHGGKRGIQEASAYLETVLNIHERQIREQIEQEPAIKRYLR